MNAIGASRRSATRGRFRVRMLASVCHRILPVCFPLFFTSCKTQEVEIQNSEFRCDGSVCDFGYDLINRLPVTTLVDVKLEAFTRRALGKGAVAMDICSEKLVSVELGPEKIIRLKEQLEVSCRIKHVRVQVIQVSSR